MSIIHKAKLIILGATALAVSGCSATSTSVIVGNTASVEEAFLSSSVVNVQPYTRTIFSSSNF